MQYFASYKRSVHFLYKYSTILLFLLALIFMTVEVTRADSPPNLNVDIPWIAGRSGVEDTMAAFNHGRRQEEIQLGLAPNTLGTLDLPSQAEWDGWTDNQKAVLIVNEERIDRAGMMPNVIGLPLQGIEPNIDTIAQTYAQVLVDNDATGHYIDGSDPFKRIDDNPVLGNCHQFLGRAENLYYSWGSGSTPLPFQIEQAFYLWIYADGGSNWGHREAVLLQDSALDGTEGFKNNVGSPNSEGFMGFAMIQSAEYDPFNKNVGIGTVIVMNFFDPAPDGSCIWPAIATSTPMPTFTPTPLPPTLTPSSTPIPTNTPTPTLTPTPTPTPANLFDSSGNNPFIDDSFKPETIDGIRVYDTVTEWAENTQNIEVSVAFNNDESEYFYDREKDIVKGRIAFDILYSNPADSLAGNYSAFSKHTLAGAVVIATIPDHTTFDPDSSGLISESPGLKPLDLNWQNLDGSGDMNSQATSGIRTGIRIGDMTSGDGGMLRFSTLIEDNVSAAEFAQMKLSAGIAAMERETETLYRIVDDNNGPPLFNLYLPWISR